MKKKKREKEKGKKQLHGAVKGRGVVARRVSKKEGLSVRVSLLVSTAGIS